MNILFTADLHFTDNPRDEYRWGLLPWLAKQASKHKVQMVVLGGDITDAKDKHSSALVNRLVAGLVEIAKICPVIILRGNHDYIDENQPFFGFTNEMNAGYGITFLTKPMTIDDLLFLPNTKNWEEEWNGMAFGSYDVIFTHATFDGCTSESGFKLSGIPPSFFAQAKKVWSGDIHKPQTVGKNIEYVGSPYRCRFGDLYLPRVVLIDQTVSGVLCSLDIRYPCQGKHLIDINNPTSPSAAVSQLALTQNTGGLEIYEGDQVKIRVHLKRSAYPEWPAIKAALLEEAAHSKLQVTGPELVALEESQPKQSVKGKDTRQDVSSPRQALAAYAEKKAVPDALLKAGEGYLKQAMGD